MTVTYSAVHGIKSKKRDLAKLIGISENTFRKYLKLLLSYNMATIDTKGILRLGGRYRIYEMLGVDPNFSDIKNRISDKWYRIEEKDFDIDHIKLLALCHKRENINFNNTKRIANQLVKTFGTIKCPKIKNKLVAKAKHHAEKIIENNKINFAEGFNPDSKYGFIDDNLSGNSIAKIFGRSSRMTGNRIMHTLAKKGLISYESRDIKITEFTAFTNINAIRETNNHPMFLSKDNSGSLCLFMRVPNAWTLL